MTALSIDKIVRRTDGRALELSTVAALAESIATVGLINPIRVRAVGDGFEVIAGAHRLEASKSLGLTEIEGEVVDADDLHAELAMIDENLCRAELSPADRAQQTARRKAIYETIHGPAKANSAKAANSAMGRGDVNAKLADTFVADTAAATGKSERATQRDAERGEKVCDQAMDLIKGTALDTGRYLDGIKNLMPSEQVHAVRRDLAFEKQKERDQASRQRQSKIDSDVKSRAAREVAEIIAEHVPGEWWDAVKANLYASGAKNIGNEFTNITGTTVFDRSAA